MAELFKVQYDEPLPPVDRRPQNTRRKYPFEQMLVGGWFFIPGKNSRSVGAYVARETGPLEGKFSVRHTWARQIDGDWKVCAATDEGAKEGTGVWRTE